VKLVIVGAGQVGREILKRLKQNWQIIIIDTDERKLKSIAEFLDSETLNRTVLLQGDGTSRLTLQRAGIGKAKVFVACTGDDEANLEACRIAKEFHIPSIYAVSNHMDHDKWFEKEGISFVNKAVATASILEMQIESGIIEATNIGLGQGEIVEVAVLPTSVLAGYPVGKFTTKKWKVAAIFRGNKLILPSERTIIRPGDRILLIGDPTILKHIVGLVSSGEPQFPLQFGSEEVVLLPKRNSEVLNDAFYIANITKAPSISIYTCFEDNLEIAELAQASCKKKSKVSSLKQCEREFIANILGKEPGIIILPNIYSEIPLHFGIKTFPVDLAETTLVPVMLSKGSSPFKKILVPVSGSFSGYRALEIATEIAIQSKAKLDAVFVSQNGNTGKIEDLKDKIRKFSSLYGIEIELKLLKGNVITEVSRISKYYNLLIIGGRKNVKNNWFTPYPPYYLLHKSKCTSLLICTEK